MNKQETIKYTLNGLLVENQISPEGEEGKILSLVSNGSADLDRIIAEMEAETSGLKKETISHVVKLYNRVTTRLLLSGYRINTGLLNGTAAFKGAIKGSSWDSETNKIIIKLQPGSYIREAVKNTTVNIVAQKGAVAYIANIKDGATGLQNGTATQGFPLEIMGNKIRIEGEDPQVGLSLIASDGSETKIDLKKLSDNDPSRVVFTIPESLKNGVYTVRLTTMFCAGGKMMLKSPRTVERTIYVGVPVPSVDTADSNSEG